MYFLICVQTLSSLTTTHYYYSKRVFIPMFTRYTHNHYGYPQHVLNSDVHLDNIYYIRFSFCSEAHR